MPLFGGLEPGAIAARLPETTRLDADGWDLPDAEILQLAWEAEESALALLPRALHPANPPYVTIVVARFPQTPVGPFQLALLRLMGRAGVHQRGFVLGAVATSSEAATALRERWGFPARVGTVSLARYYDRVTAGVTCDGAGILEVALVNPEPISGADLLYLPSITLARVSRNGRSTPTLIQVDPHYTFREVERGRPMIGRLDVGAWQAPTLRLTTPISASFARCDTDLPRIRFVFDPEAPAAQGTRRLA